MYYQIKVENIKGEVAGLRFARTSVGHQMERECLHSFLWEHCFCTVKCSSPPHHLMEPNNYRSPVHAALVFLEATLIMSSIPFQQHKMLV